MNNKKRVFGILTLALVLGLLSGGILLLNSGNENKKNNCENDVNVPVEKDPVYEKEEYDYLKDELTKVLKVKNFGGENDKWIYALFDFLYDKYDKKREILEILGYPEKKEYILNQLIAPLSKYVNSFTVYEEDDPKWEKAFIESHGEGETIGVRGFYLRENHSLHFLKSDETEPECAEEKTTCEIMFHEIVHSGQENILGNYDDLSLWYTFVEGEAVMHEATLVEYKDIETYNVGGWNIADKKNATYSLAIRSEGTMIQGVDGNAFMKIQLLVGYEATEKYKVDGNIKNIASIIDKKYGAEVSKKVFDNIKIINAANYEYDDISTEDAFKAAYELETTILECMKKDIGNLSSKEKIVQYSKFYKYYLDVHLISYVEEIEKTTYENGEKYIESTIIDHSDKLYDLKGLKNLLTNRAKECKVNLDI